MTVNTKEIARLFDSKFEMLLNAGYNPKVAWLMVVKAMAHAVNLAGR